MKHSRSGLSVRLVLAAATLSPLLVSPAWSQSALFTFDGDASDDRFGESVDGAGDVNGDGVPDIVVGARLNDGNGADAGAARIFSGADGSALFTFYGDRAGDQFGVSVCGAGDVNGDGFDDVIVGADWPFTPNLGYARVFSGFDGAVLHTFLGDDPGDTFGFSVGGAGDVNGDGFDDLLVGAYLDDDNGVASGRVKVFSGSDGAVLYTLDGDSAGDFFGYSARGAGDVDGDGFADFIVGAWLDDDNGVDSGSARVYSGVDGSTLYSFYGEAAGDLFGHSVNGAGDVNGDGYSDFIVGAHRDDNNGTWSGTAWVFSGVDGALLHVFEGESALDEFGDSVSGAGDVNGDGFDDLVIGAPYDDKAGWKSGSARVHSGADGSLLFTVDGGAEGDMLGFSVAGIGDVDGDGLDDVVLGAGWDDNNGLDSGSATVFSGCAELGARYCTPGVVNSSGRPGEIRACGSDLVLENRLYLSATHLPAHQFAYFLVSEQTAFLVNFGGGAGPLCLGGEIGRFASGVGDSGPSGTVGIHVDLTDLPPPAQQVVLPGETWHFQAWYRDVDPQATSKFTDALSVSFQ